MSCSNARNTCSVGVNTDRGKAGEAKRVCLFGVGERERGWGGGTTHKWVCVEKTDEHC